MWWWCWAAPDSSRESRRPAKRVRLQQTHSAQCCVHEDDGSQARQGPARWAVWLPPRHLAAGGAPGALGGCRNGGRRPGDRLGGRRCGGAAICHLRECTSTGRCCLCAPPPVTELRAVWPTWMPAARRRMSGASRRPAATPPSQRSQPRCRCLPPTRVASWQRLSHRTRTRRLTPRTAAAPQALWPAPAFVCLNEVDLAKQPGALETVADALGGMTVSFYGHVADADGVERYGNALLSRWPPAALRKVRRQLLHWHPLPAGWSPETAGPSPPAATMPRVCHWPPPSVQVPLEGGTAVVAGAGSTHRIHRGMLGASRRPPTLLQLPAPSTLAVIARGCCSRHCGVGP